MDYYIDAHYLLVADPTLLLPIAFFSYYCNLNAVVNPEEDHDLGSRCALSIDCGSNTAFTNCFLKQSKGGVMPRNTIQT